MKISATVFASLFVLVGVSACSSSEREEEELGEVDQALCAGGRPCRGTGGGGAYIPPGGGTVAPTDPGPTFSCPLKVEVPCGPVLKQTSPGVYECVNSCGGGGFGVARFNPCPSWAPRYTCTPYGVCSCY